MLFEILLVILGFVLLIFGADALVKGSSALARRLKMSDLAIGLTIVAFGTSAPELVVSSVASVKGQSDLILGNVLGSNLFNLMMILGIVALIKPIIVQKSMVWIEIPISLAVVVVLYVLSNSFFENETGLVSRLDAIILLVLFAGFMFYIYKGLSKESTVEATPAVVMSNLKLTLLIVFGLAGLVYGGHLVVTNATDIALQFGVSEKVIGLTIVAAGTSLPELVTSVVAALKKNADIAIGNVIGSNIFNVLLIVPISALIHPIAYNSSFNFEMYLLAGATLFLFIAMFSGKAKRLDRWEALILLVGFVVYTGYMVTK
ncbi:calcium/sodium antiporter [Psychroflexus montanilacus]|uniref:calcium/sodium antiporter n=1 Tax=Psychroflexus montanilacus TaxID=2873598 RepID=UPI001CD0090E|nr:calcium/sodium antiporter [Psychroflexus montanilacus]MBZ9650971.1 calcium/sodium antiporter [Psychroflexus montanilacus]